MIFANGLSPSSSALDLLIKTRALAPSFKFEALAAVTIPSDLKTGLRLGILSNLTALYSSSSLTMVSVP
jgi:hypothetical protein